MNELQPPYPGPGWHPAAPPVPGPSWGEVTLRTIAGAIGVMAGAFWLLCMILVLSSVFSSNPASDPHGYVLVFGTLFGVPAGLIGALVLPLAFGKGKRALAYLIVVTTFATIQALIFTAMYLW